mgnify:CR=1 FL=1
MKYTLVKSTTKEGLTKGVNKMLASGWKLQGGIAVNNTLAGSDYFYQAIIKEG